MKQPIKYYVILILSVFLLLFIPFTAAQFSDEIKWDLMDYLLMGILLMSTGTLCQLTFWKFKKSSYKFLICAAILAAFFTIWAELAVGIFGTRFSGS